MMAGSRGMSSEMASPVCVMVSRTKMSRPADRENAWVRAFSDHTDRPVLGGDFDQYSVRSVKLTCIALTSMLIFTEKVSGGHSSSVP